MQNERCTEDIVVRMARCILNFSFTFVFKEYCEIAEKGGERFGDEITADFFAEIDPREKEAIREKLALELRRFVSKRLEEGIDFSVIGEAIKSCQDIIARHQSSEARVCFTIRVPRRSYIIIPCIGIVLCESLELLGEIIKKLKFEFEII